MLLKVDCLPNAVGKQPSIPLRKEMMNMTDVSDMKMTRFRQGVDLICE